MWPYNRLMANDTKNKCEIPGPRRFVAPRWGTVTPTFGGKPPEGWPPGAGRFLIDLPESF